MSDDKKLVFHCFVIYLAKWYMGKNFNDDFNGKEIELFNNTNDFSNIKILKMLFFCSAVSIIKNNGLLSKRFDNFKAMPYGPVEIDVYEYLKNNENEDCIIFESKKIKLKNTNILIDEDKRKQILKDVNSMKEINKGLIKKDPFALVDISHKWRTWQNRYKEARAIGKYQNDMKLDDVIYDVQYYS